jgi:hypothetical protein
VAGVLLIQCAELFCQTIVTLEIEHVMRREAGVFQRRAIGVHGTNFLWQGLRADFTRPRRARP